VEAREDPGVEGEVLGQDPLARPDTREHQGGNNEQSSDGEDDTGLEEFVEAMETDPARAGVDSPAQDLMGG
jgi:hypothetical protein